MRFEICPWHSALRDYGESYLYVPRIWTQPLRLWARSPFLKPRFSLSDFGEELPLRAELFSGDQLQRHAKEFAASHRLSTSRSGDNLLTRLDENERVLIETYELVTAATAQNRRIEPAAEWLLDNFYLVEEQIRSIRRLLPPAYSRELPDRKSVV